ncbi:MAG: hypothetical protein AAF483_13365 [Planctomycetota bacterium]
MNSALQRVLGLLKLVGYAGNNCSQETDVKFMASRRIVSIAVALLVLAAAIAANWIYPYEVYARVDTQAIYSDLMSRQVDLRSDSILEPTLPGDFRLGGWPFRYYYSRETIDGSMLTALSYPKLGLNILSWGLLFAFCYGYEFLIQRRRKTDSSAGSKQEKRRLSLSDLLVVTAVIACVLVYVRSVYKAAAVHSDLAASIVESGGSAGRVAYGPSILKGRLPDAIVQSLMRLSRAEVIQPTDAQVKALMELRTVEELLLSGGEYDLRLLDGLKRKTSLRGLRVAGRKIDAQLIVSIGSAKQLERLSLIFTNVTAEGMEALGEMPVLYGVDLANTDVYLEQDSLPAWGRNVMVLSLPSSTSEARQRLVDWPQLRTVRVEDPNSVWSSTEIQLELRDLPNLTHVRLESTRQFQFSAENVPRLHTIGSAQTRVNALPKNQPYLAGSRLTKFHLKNAESLARVWLTMASSPRISLDGVPNLNLGLRLDAYTALANNMIKQGDMLGGETTREERQEWIDGFVSLGDLPSLDLSRICLKDLDLSTLANSKLKHLDLSYTALAPRDLFPLKDATSIESIDLTGCQVSGADVEKLLKILPNVRVLKVDQFNQRRLRIVGHDRLESVVGRRFPDASNVDALHLQNLPNFRDVVDLTNYSQYLHLENVPSLKGIICFGPMPKRVKVSGLRDLEVFAGGGGNVTDEIAQEVLACAPLSKLTLAYAELADETLSRIGERGNLKVLVLTGTKLGAKAEASLQNLTGLQKLRLENTGVANGVLARLLAAQSGLEEFGASDVNQEVGAALARSQSLRVLRLAESEVDAKLMQQICRLPALQILDLRGCTLSEDAVAVLASGAPSTLVQISLREAKAKGFGLRKLAVDKPWLRWDIEELDVNFIVLDYLLENCKLLDAVGMNVSGGRSIMTERGQYPDYGEVPASNYMQGAQDSWR